VERRAAFLAAAIVLAALPGCASGPLAPASTPAAIEVEVSPNPIQREPPFHGPSGPGSGVSTFGAHWVVRVAVTQGAGTLDWVRSVVTDEESGVRLETESGAKVISSLTGSNAFRAGQSAAVPQAVSAFLADAVVQHHFSCATTVQFTDADGGVQTKTASTPIP
jgi:hypothetical protein